VLSKGKVVSAGRHDELMTAGGWYAGAVRLQQLKDDSPVLSSALSPK
jgi:ABC-type multidrug transport system fused ATPase/permease subunit